ncbi:Acyltransferase [Stackebrandtia soli]
MVNMIDVTRVRATLGLAPESAAWYDTWNAVDVPGPAPIPTAKETRDILNRLGVDEIDIDAAVAARPDPRADPELWWLVERCYRQLVGDMGGTDMIVWPRLGESTGHKGRFAYLYALLAALPTTLAFHASRGIGEDVTWATLANLGEKLRLNRARYGVPGLSVAFWFTLHFRGSLYQLGRLEYAIERVREDDGFPGLAPGDLKLGVHIPGEGGPMSPQACAASLALVDDFFARHFPEHFAEPATLTCSSWLLDPQLRTGLDTTSNIIALQDLFALTPPSPYADANGRKDVLLFVFNRVGDVDPTELPRGSRLERMLADGLAAGTRWQVRSGVVKRPFPLSAKR